MVNVLIVDDEESFLASLEVGLLEYSAEFSVFTANNGKDAVKILESKTVDLIVTDIRMPQMDGFALLAYLSKYFPLMPAIVMSAYGTPETKRKLEKLGTLKFMDKPIDFQELAEAILDGLKLGLKAVSVEGFSLAGFLQLIEMEQKTCLLEVHSEKKQKGLFYFNKGKLFDAICDKNQGDEAAVKMIAWDKVAMTFKNLQGREIKKRITTELMSLLMEGMRRKDEKYENDTTITTKRGKKMVINKDSIQSLIDQPGFICAAVYTGDSMPLLFEGSDTIDSEKFSGFAIELYKRAKAFSDGLDLGEGEFVEIQTDKSIFVHTCIVPGVAAIGVLIKKAKGNVGLLRHAIRQISTELEPDFK